MLKMALLGGMNLSVDSHTPAVTPTVQSLLAYLVLYRHRTHPRQVLAGLYWGNYSEKRAQNSLRTALWRLRRALEPEGVARGTYLLTDHRHAVAFNRESAYWLDAEQFETGVEAALRVPVSDMTESQAAALEKALALYTGDLLDGFYEEWIQAERERFYRLCVNGIERLMYYYHRIGDYERALTCGRRILQQDPLKEDIHREVMDLYKQNGQRASAIRQFEICRAILKDELGIEPMAATQTLYRQLMNGTPANSARESQENTSPPGENVAGGADKMDQALDHLEHAIHRLDAAQRELQHAIAQVTYLRSQRDA